MCTKRAFVENDYFDPEEAIEAAIDKRTFFIKRLSNDHEFEGEEDNKESDDN